MESHPTFPSSLFLDHALLKKPHTVLAAVSCPKILFQLFALADLYDILPLKTNILNHLWEFVVINRKKLIYTASIAFSYRELYADISTEMLKREATRDMLNFKRTWFRIPGNISI